MFVWFASYNFAIGYLTFYKPLQLTKTKYRQSIANKVTSKKAEKGYTLSEEKCTDCDMNLLMSSTGKSECKVCPAIKKWVQRKNDNNNSGTYKF